MFRLLCTTSFAAAAAFFFVGCDKKPASTEFTGKNQEHEHGKNTRDVTLPDGKLAHVTLSAHLDEKAGNELDVIFEKHEKEESYPIPINAKLTARVTRKGIDKEENLEFKPAEKDERKDDPDGKCSRFSADAKWMKPDDELTVVLSIEYDGKLKKATYTPFVPKDSAHTHEHK